jgi:ABC-2 type transport system permease protein
VIATLGILLSVFAENSIGPIVATVCIVLFFTIVSNINVPVIDKHVKPWLFTSYMVGWKGFFYIGIDNEGQPIKGSLENWPAIRNSLLILIAHIGTFLGIAFYSFQKKDILS